MSVKAVLSVLGKDKKGIVASISTALFECGVNIDDISQSILDDVFSMTMMVTVDEEVCSFNDVQERLATVAEALQMRIFLQRSDVFDFMYKI